MGNSYLVKLNEIFAEKKIEEGDYDEAEKVLLQNVKEKTSSEKTYQLMVKIYSIKNDYSSLIKILNMAIKYSSGNKKVFRELKRVTILNKLLEDMGGGYAN